MSLPRRKRCQKLRLPDYIALALLASVALSAMLWWDAQFNDIWLQTTGRVLEGRVIQSHYNAPPTKQRVQLVYAYSVGGVMYQGQWTGYWPAENSPNALPENRYGELFSNGYPLKVSYEAGNPARSELHHHAPERHFGLAGTTVGLAVAAGIYLIRVYPHWRRSVTH
ncbi:MAG: DUF3592 domain-containing protein [Candidatus Hydrogenedentota bacterium]